MQSLYRKSSVILIPVPVRFNSWVCGRSLTGISGWNPAGGHGCLSLVNAVRCQIQLFARGRSLVQRSPSECVCVCVIKYDEVQQYPSTITMSREKRSEQGGRKISFYFNHMQRLLS